MKTRIYPVVALTLILLSQIPAAVAPLFSRHSDTMPVSEYIPFEAVVIDGNKVVRAQLNQDYSWTITGDPTKLAELGYGGYCLAKRLAQADRNPFPDNTAPLDTTQLTQIIVGSDVLRPCLLYLKESGGKDV